VTGDRGQPGGYDGLPDQSRGLVVDVASQPGYVRSAVRALAERARRWVYVSSLSVYRDNSEPGADESAEILPALDSDQATIEQYGEGKVACEEALRSALLDVTDLAVWLVDAGLSGATGMFNAIGEVRRFDDLLAACQAATGHRGEVIVAAPDWLIAQGVTPWMGPRSLPVWTPGQDYAGFFTRSRAAAEALGLPDPDLDGLARGALAWERTCDPTRTRRAGLTDDEQQELLARL
jgi:hypothetical protein